MVVWLEVKPAAPNTLATCLPLQALTCISLVDQCSPFIKGTRSLLVRLDLVDIHLYAVCGLPFVPCGPLIWKLSPPGGQVQFLSAERLEYKEWSSVNTMDHLPGHVLARVKLTSLDWALHRSRVSPFRPCGGYLHVSPVGPQYTTSHCCNLW